MLVLTYSSINIIRIYENACAGLIHKNKHVENMFLSFVFKSQFANLHDSHIEYVKEINFLNHLTINYLISMKQTSIRLLFIFQSTQAEFSLRVEFPAKQKKKKKKKRKKENKEKEGGEKKLDESFRI